MPLQQSCSHSWCESLARTTPSRAFATGRPEQGSTRSFFPSSHSSLTGTPLESSTPQSPHFWLPPGVFSWAEIGNRQESSSQHRKPPRSGLSTAGQPAEVRLPLGSQGLVSDAARRARAFWGGWDLIRQGSPLLRASLFKKGPATQEASAAPPPTPLQEWERLTPQLPCP